ncbi:MAG: DinB family protein [Acidobacteriota bacterium]
MSIVKAVFEVEHCRVPRGPYEMLEPDVGKLASPVFRGRGGGNIALLPGRLPGRDSEEIMDTQTLIATLEAAPGIIIGLVREVPPQNLKRRPAPNKWSAHEHACHISTGQATFLSRLELMLSDPLPQIKSMEPSPDEEAGSLLSVDLDEALGRYVRERALVVKRLKELSADDWQRTAEHEAFSHYSVYIMFRHLLMHEMLHAYRIDELMLKKDWE